MLCQGINYSLFIFCRELLPVFNTKKKGVPQIFRTLKSDNLYSHKRKTDIGITSKFYLQRKPCDARKKESGKSRLLKNFMVLFY